MKLRVMMTYACANMHLTEVEMHDPVISEDGSVQGYVGSSADFCDVCDSSSMTAMDARSF